MAIDPSDLPQAARIPVTADPLHWAEVVHHRDGAVTLCLSPKLAKAWSEHLATGLGALAVYLGPELIAAIRERPEQNGRSDVGGY